LGGGLLPGDKLAPDPNLMGLPTVTVRRCLRDDEHGADGGGARAILRPKEPHPRGRRPGPPPTWEPTDSPFVQARNPPLDFHSKRKFRKGSRAWIMVDVITQQLFFPASSFFWPPQVVSPSPLGHRQQGPWARLSAGIISAILYTPVDLITIQQQRLGMNLPRGPPPRPPLPHPTTLLEGVKG